jgi:hypothetical protein
MTHSIYSPQVRREALRYGITELQAWRKLKAREAIMRAQDNRHYLTHAREA